MRGTVQIATASRKWWRS